MIYALVSMAALAGFLLGVGIVRIVDSRSSVHGAIDFVDLGEPNVLYLSNEESKKLGSAKYLKLRINRTTHSQN